MPSEQPGNVDGQSLKTENPRGANPSNDVSCANCGAYRTLYGPVDLDGKRVDGGDMVCESCLSSRKGDDRPRDEVTHSGVAKTRY